MFNSEAHDVVLLLGADAGEFDLYTWEVHVLLVRELEIVLGHNDQPTILKLLNHLQQQHTIPALDHAVNLQILPDVWVRNGELLFVSQEFVIRC